MVYLLKDIENWAKFSKYDDVIQNIFPKTFPSYHELAPHKISDQFQINDDTVYHSCHTEVANTLIKKVLIIYIKYPLRPVCHVQHFFNQENFKRKVKTRKPDNYPCSLCKVYIDNVRFL